MEFEATIYYTIDKNHPDIDAIPDWKQGKQYTYTDTYKFDRRLYHPDDSDMMKQCIKKDLRLIAGGGYNSRHIHNVHYDIHKV